MSERFNPGDPITSGDALIEDDEALLPHELQTGGAIWEAVVGVLYRHESAPVGATQAEVAADVMRALTPVLWPLLPSNDDNDAIRAVRNVPRRQGTPEWSEHNAIPQAVGYDMGLAAAQDAIRSVQS